MAPLNVVIAINGWEEEYLFKTSNTLHLKGFTVFQSVSTYLQGSI